MLRRLRVIADMLTLNNTIQILNIGSNSITSKIVVNVIANAFIGNIITYAGVEGLGL